MNWENQLTKTARIHYPVIQAPVKIKYKKNLSLH